MDDVIWLSYADLAARLGIGHESARQKVKRGRWTRRKDNTGTVMIGVPVEVLQAHDERKRAPEHDLEHDPDHSNDDPEQDLDRVPDYVASALSSHISRLERELEAISKERDDARSNLRDAERTNALIEAQLAGLNATLAARDELLSAERARVEEWKAVADRFATQAEKLTAADEARRSWWPWRRSA
jgi:septal ring factor EnvC (AmiA/AmiB activator)